MRTSVGQDMNDIVQRKGTGSMRAELAVAHTVGHYKDGHNELERKKRYCERNNTKERVDRGQIGH